MIHLIKYLKTETIAKETAAFYFKKPLGFVYKAGQSGNFTLINPPETDTEGNSRSFSLISAPNEEYLAIATRLRDTAFKRVLRGLKPGEELIFEAPLGNLTLQDNTSRPAIFLAGGIGIAPFRSIILGATEKKLTHKIYLFYSNKNPEDAPFLEELSALQGENENFKLIATMTQTDKSRTDWSGETGYINAALLSKHLPDLMNPIYYLAGPIAMVQALHKTLSEVGVSDDNIKIEEFIGY